MTIIEIRSTVTRKSLERKSKSDLISMVLETLRFCDEKERKRQEYEDALRPFAEKFKKVHSWQYQCKHIPKGISKEKWFKFLDSNPTTPELDTGFFRKAWELINGRKL